MATSSVIDLIEGNAAVPTAASKGLPTLFPRVHAAGRSPRTTSPRSPLRCASSIRPRRQRSVRCSSCSASGCASVPSPHSTLQGAGKPMSRCRWLRSPRSAGCPRRRPVTSFCMNLRTCWLQTPAIGSAWRYAARQVGLLRPCAWPDSGALADWREIAPAIRATLQAIPEPTESLPAEYYDDRLRRAGSGGSRPGSRCAHPSPGTVPESARIRSQVRRQRPCSAGWGWKEYHQGAAGPSQRPTAARRTAVPVARRSPNMLRQPVKRGSSGAAGVGVDRTVASGAQRPHSRFR